MIHNIFDPSNTDTICALATPAGTGAIAVIRISGPDSIPLTSKIFFPRNKKLILEEANSHSLFFGEIKNEDAETIDEVVVSVFKNPKSFTGEDSIEISCHGSIYIQQRLIELIIENGARLAKPGEFTLRAFFNNKFDLSQAEAVADLISANSKSSHELAMKQMKGGFSEKIKNLRVKLLNFASLIELELDFSEEDVEFANREELLSLIDTLKKEISQLTESFKVGNVIKKGIPVAIVGKPNVGKSTLLNALLDEEKAIVSDIPGTTRDVIEDTFIINGIAFRFIDTAGLRESDDHIENIGIERTYEKINEASIVLYMIDMQECTEEIMQDIKEQFQECIEDPNKHFVLVGNKIDQMVNIPTGFKDLLDMDITYISAKRKENINELSEKLVKSVQERQETNDTIITNARHYEALTQALNSILQVEHGFHSSIPTDLISIDIRQALHHLGEITGEITTDEVLGNIFGKFCIGK
ncbi:MAG: tRNA uridine-5-carboxymethylaminomethyl(34) synthesis GTPase MnmE [Bacteroidales bacterium]